MQDVTTLWPEVKKGDWGLDHAPGYSEIISKIGTVLVESWDNDYQGDTFALIEKDGRYGYLCFGWGSCSGCDALQACDSIEGLQDLCNGLESSVQWFDSKEAIRKWIEERDWEGQFEWHTGAKEFVPKALATLSMTREVSPEVTR